MWLYREAMPPYSGATSPFPWKNRTVGRALSSGKKRPKSCTPSWEGKVWSLAPWGGGEVSGRG